MAKSQKTAATSARTLNSAINKVPISTLLVIAILLFVGSVYFWWKEVYTEPQNVFRNMLNNSLRLEGISRTVTQDSQDQGMLQRSRLNLTGSGQPIVQSETTLTQGNNTTVITESLGTATDDFVRYTSIETDQTNESGEKLDFKDVIGQWGRRENSGSGDFTDGELYSEHALGVVLMGNLDPEQRRQLLELIEKEKVYEVDYSLVEKTVQNGRTRYTYPVGVDAEGYVKLLKLYGELTGLNSLASLTPEDYANQPRLQFSLVVDVLSQQLAGIENSDSTRTESYSSHGASQAVSLPTETVTVEELQSRLQSQR